MTFTAVDAKTIDQALLDENWKLAVQLSTRWIKEEPSCALAWGQHARAQSAFGHHDIAIDAISKALELEPKNLAFLYKLGRIHMNAKNFDKAEIAFGQCVDYAIEAQDAVFLDAGRLAKMKCLILLNREKEAQRFMAEPHRPKPSGPSA